MSNLPVIEPNPVILPINEPVILAPEMVKKQRSCQSYTKLKSGSRAQKEALTLMITKLKEATDDGLNDLRGQSSVEDVEKMLYDVVDEMKKASTTDLTLSIHEKCLAIAYREITQKLLKAF